jgi:chorismate synthase
MLGCHIGKNFQVTIAGGSYQEGLTAMIHGNPPGMLITEQEIYGDLLLRKPGADELSSPRVEPDLPIIYSGVNAADTIENGQNAFLTNGTPFTILIPNLDRHFIHIKQYQDTNRTPRPGHCSYASFKKYGPFDDAIGAGFFSGRYTATIVAAGYVAKRVLEKFGIQVFSYVKEAAKVVCPDVDYAQILEYTKSYKQMRCDLDPFYQEIYVKGRVKNEMRFLEKTRIFSEIEKEIQQIREKTPKMTPEAVVEKYGVHPVINCPDIDAGNAMVAACNKIYKTGDSSGGVVEVVVTGAPAGLGEPMFYKLDAELGRMLGIGAVKCVEVGSGYAAKSMVGSESNDTMHSENGEVVFDSNNAGGITGGLTTGQPIVARLVVKPTPTIDKRQNTIDKYTLENTELAAITRRDPTIVARIWPVAEALTAIIMVDHLTQHLGYQALMK